MKANIRIVPDYEVIICPPAESFRWFEHDYPHHLAKWHYHPEYELHLTRHRGGAMMVGDYMGEFEPGCLVLTGPNVPHNWVSTLTPGEVLHGRDTLVQFTQDWADRLTGLCPELSGLRMLFEEAAFGLEFTGATARAGRALLSGIGAARGPERAVLFLRLMERLARDPGERRRLSRLAPDRAPADLPPELDAAMRFILERYAEEIDLASVARHCGLAPQAFSRLFKRHTGHTFARYLVLARVYAACTLLTQSRLPITDVCFEAGFNNVANFNRQFIKVCGRTPSEWRKGAQKVATEARPDPFREGRGGLAGARPEPAAGGKV